MNMKSGKSLLLLSISLLIFLSQRKSSSSLDRYKEYPLIRQYINRFKEFFEINEIKEAESNFLSLIDHGFDPKVAFETIIKKVMI